MSVHKPSILGGTMIIAGTSIGAGMLALPTISAGMWFYWSLLLLFVTWIVMMLSSQALLEVNLHYEPGASFHTLVKDTLGQGAAVFNGATVAFVLYILVYAYVSGGGSIVEYVLSATVGWSPPRSASSLAFALALAACVWWSTKMVDRLSIVLMGGMAITFALSMSGLLPGIRMAILKDVGGGGSKAVFIWAALSTYLTSFCFHASVPSLVKYFGKKPGHINHCLIYGTLIALCCYLLWILACNGNIPREEFKNIIAAGGNVSHLIQAASGSLSTDFMLRMLETFSALAVATSFLGAGLGLFDYIADLCGFDDSRMGRTKTALITFVPPTVGGLISPNGFLYAIGWAGLAATIWSVIIPALMVWKSRRMFPASAYFYKAPLGGLLVPLLLLAGLTTAVCHTLFAFGILPMFK